MKHRMLQILKLKMFLTRIGENSKIVINGDPSQIDLTNKNLSGLDRSKKILGHLKENYGCILIIQMLSDIL